MKRDDLGLYCGYGLFITGQWRSAASGEVREQHCIAKILKAKAWKRKGSNPDGKQLRFQIEDGWRIHHWADWHYGTKEPKRDKEFHPRRTN